MKLNKWLAVGALIPALLLTGCTGGGEEKPPIATPAPSITPDNVQPPGQNTGEDPFKDWKEGDLLGYAATPEFAHISSKYGSKIVFDDSRKFLTYYQAYAAVSTAERYIMKSFDNGYFMANWWGNKDQYSQAGIKDISHLLGDEAKRNLETYAAALATDPTNEEANKWLDSFLFMPPENPDYMVLDLCTDEWVMSACRSQEPEIGEIKVTRDNKGYVNVQTTVTVYPVYNQVLDGKPGIVSRTYTLNLDLAPARVPAAIETTGTEEEIIVNESTDPIDEKAEPLYVVIKAQNTVKANEPVAY